MSIRIADDGQPYAACHQCGRKEYGGSFDRLTFAEYLPKLGWGRSKKWEHWVWLCPECFRDSMQEAS